MTTFLRSSVRILHLSLASLALFVTQTATTAQATLLGDLAPGPRSSEPEPAIEFDGRFFFRACPAGNRTNYFLYGTDGTPTGTTQFSTFSIGADLLRAGNRLFYSAQTAAAGMELWSSDGVTPGTMVSDLLPGMLGSFPLDFVALGDRLVFTASAVSGRRLYVSDGTTVGTVELAQVPMAFNGRNRLAVQGGRVWFTGIDAELWNTDGTVAGTQRVADIRAGVLGSNPGSLTAYQGRVWFTADDGVHGTELWHSDGTPLGTALFFEGTAGANGTQFTDFTIAGGQLFFPIGGRLFVTDGFPGGTHEVLANPAFVVRGGAGFGSLTALGNSVYFAGTSAGTGTELWRSDGTAAGTYMVRDIWPGAGDGVPVAAPMRLLGSRHLWFHGQDAASGQELWRSDGTPNGTQVAIDYTPGPGGSYNAFAGLLLRTSLVRGRIMFDPADATVWQEPFAFWAGGSAQAIGFGCSATIGTVRISRLSGTDAVLGGVVRFEGADAPGGSLAAMALGFQAATPVSLPNGCRVWLDPASVVGLPPFWVNSGGWQSNLAIPLSPTLSGLLLGAQCFYFGSNRPGGYESSNAVLLGLGS
jgi:ELWxxDGT repeat protein